MSRRSLFGVLAAFCLSAGILAAAAAPQVVFRSSVVREVPFAVR
jgi:hypothetical protein